MERRAAPLVDDRSRLCRCREVQNKMDFAAGGILPGYNPVAPPDLDRQSSRSFSTTLCPMNWSGSAPDYFHSAFHLYRKRWSQSGASRDTVRLARGGPLSKELARARAI